MQKLPRNWIITYISEGRDISCYRYQDAIGGKHTVLEVLPTDGPRITLRLPALTLSSTRRLDRALANLSY